MDVLKAETRLEKMTASSVQPTLTAPEISLLLEMFSRVDANGKTPSDSGWIPTYDLKAAAAEGWRWKAAKASELISADLDGERLSSNQVFEHCQQMVQFYARKNQGSFSMGQG